MTPLEGLLETFGPFLIPAVVFAVGVVGYFVLLALTRLFRSEGPEEWTDRE